MFVVLSALFIMFLYDSNLSKNILLKPLDNIDFYKVFVQFGAPQILLVLINNIVNYLIFMVLPKNLLILSILITTLIVISFNFFLSWILKKVKITEYFNLNSILYIFIINCILLLNFSVNILSTILVAIFNSLGFLIVGIILISILNYLIEKKKKFNNFTVVLIVSSIILMIITGI